jgi:hypothetical protein
MKQFTTFLATPFLCVCMAAALGTTSSAQGIKDLEGTINVDGSRTIAVLRGFGSNPQKAANLPDFEPVQKERNPSQSPRAD